GILRVSPQGGTPEVIAAIERDEIATSPQLLPGGRAVLFTVKKLATTWDQAQIVAQALNKGARKVLVTGGSDGRYLPPGHIVYALSGTLLAVSFDSERLEISGAPVPVLEGVRRTNQGAVSAYSVDGSGQGVGMAQFSYGQNGTHAYVPGPAKLASLGADRDLALFDRKGAAQPLKLPAGSYRSPRVSTDGKTVAFDSEDQNEAIVWVYDLSGASPLRRLTFGGRNR